MLYYELMTPDWLYKHAIITKPFTVYSNYIDFPTGGTTHQRLIQTELIAPNTLTATDDVAVTLTVAMNVVKARAIFDPIFGVSDGSTFCGFIAVHTSHYISLPPCYKFEGLISSDKALSNIRRDYTAGHKVTSRAYSSEITIQIKPNEQWGSCHTEHDEGHIKISNYDGKLDLTKGLYLEIYCDSTSEQYNLEYIKTSVHRN